MNGLIGYTGFVGSNLVVSHPFEKVFNSKNIEEAFSCDFDVVVYAGVRAEKFLANQQPEEDLRAIKEAMENIQKIKAKRFVLISTIDVYKQPQGINEETIIDEEGLNPYGLHRRWLEKWVEENVENSLIVRLPALYGENLKKNFIYDMIHMIPAMLKAEKFVELQSELTIDIASYYEKQANGFYKLRSLVKEEQALLRRLFCQHSFNALSFTHPQNEYQFYPLQYLWSHIQVALNNKLRLLCLNSEPVSAGELYQHVFNKEFVNSMTSQPLKYDLRSRYGALLGGHDGYVFDKQFILEDIKKFVNGVK